MKKKIGIPLVIVVLIAVWLGVAWHTGKRIEAQTHDAIAALNAAWAKNPAQAAPQIKQISYERGLLSSHARYALTVPTLPGQDPIAVDVTFSHGPFPLAALRQGHLLPQKHHTHIELLASSGPLKMAADQLMDGKPLTVWDIGCTYGHHCAGTVSVPPIHTELSSLVSGGKLNFGGVQGKFDVVHRTDTDYTVNFDVQLLPLTINGQDFGSGQVTATSDAQSFNEQFSWKTGQGESKLAMALALTRPMPMWGAQTFQPEDLPGLFKSASLNTSLSKPMLIDLAMRAINLTQPNANADDTREMVTGQLDALLKSNPETAQFIRDENDLILSDWQYADGKLTINGQDRPEILNQIKQSYQTRLQQERPPASGGAGDGDDGESAPASAPGAAASSKP